MLGKRSRIELKTPEQFAHMRLAGLVVARGLELAGSMADPGVTTGAINEAVAALLAQERAQSNFLGYHGYPAVICASVNDEVVHGIPGGRRLSDGDLLSVDCGAIIDGWHADAAVTFSVGEVSPRSAELSEVTEQALWAGIAAIRPGGRLSDIGAAIEACNAQRFGIVRDYVGHGIGSAMHMEPSVPNHGPPGHGPVLKVGMALAIEPMLTLGSPAVRVLSDDWTVVTLDRSTAAHWEHSVAITEEGPFVLTAVDGGAARLRLLGGTVGALR